MASTPPTVHDAMSAYVAGLHAGLSETHRRLQFLQAVIEEVGPRLVDAAALLRVTDLPIAERLDNAIQRLQAPLDPAVGPVADVEQAARNALEVADGILDRREGRIAALEKELDQLRHEAGKLVAEQMHEAMTSRAKALEAAAEMVEEYGPLPGLSDACAQIASRIRAAISVRVHILSHGVPLCRFTRALPCDWPEGHQWVREGDKSATCQACLASRVR